MNPIALSKISAPSTFLEAQLVELEKQYSCHIAIHDHWGRLVTAGGVPFFTNRTLHRSPCCCWKRLEAKDFNNLCVEHCKFAIQQFTQRDSAPFVSVCWKGLNEIVVPVYSSAKLLATCYAGPFRFREQAPEPPEHPGLDEEYLTLWRQLPDYGLSEVTALARQLQVFGLAMLQLLEMSELDSGTEENQRKVRILRFVREHANRPLELKDLAAVLRLSPSRTSHLVRELFGESFARVLREERVRCAAVLLRNRELTLSEIAEKSGFCNEYYFNRIFRLKTGMSPGAFRKTYGETDV